MPPPPSSVSAPPLAERFAYVYLMMRGGGREEEVLHWFVSIMKRAEGGGREGRRGRRRGTSSSGGARRVRLEEKGDRGEEKEGGRKGVKRDATLVLVASSLAVLYVVAGGSVKRGREGLAVGVATSETLLEERSVL